MIVAEDDDIAAAAAAVAVYSVAEKMLYIPKMMMLMKWSKRSIDLDNIYGSRSKRKLSEIIDLVK